MEKRARRHRMIEQPADHGEAQVEALVQLGADIGERAEHGDALDEHADPVRTQASCSMR